MFKLEPYHNRKSRYKCPKCNKPFEFTRYIDYSGNYIADDVGRCNREQRCGYHKKPIDHFKENNFQYHKNIAKSCQMPKDTIKYRNIDFLPNDLMLQTFQHYDKNNLFKYLSHITCDTTSLEMLRKYNVGTSKHWEGATAFWQVDIKGRVRQVKIILYDNQNGRRIKNNIGVKKWNDYTGVFEEGTTISTTPIIYGRYIQKGKYNNCNLVQCFFGEHLLVKSGIVAVVESEKTAIIADYLYPNFIWIATGGSNGASFSNPEVFNVLANRKVIFFPDLGQFENWKNKSISLIKNIPCSIWVSDILEKYASINDKEKGYDIADYILASLENKESDFNVSQEEVLTQDLVMLNTSQKAWVPISENIHF
jgi:hypothetical protein